MSTPHLALAAVAGLASFLSPCMLPVVPAFVARLGGVSVAGEFDRHRVFGHALLFVVGFSLVFATLGVALESVLAGATATVQTWLARIAGLLVVAVGLHLTGLVEVTAFERGATLPGGGDDPSPTATLLLGGAFAVTWTPCTGPLLGSAFALAASEPAAAFPVFLSYSLGLGVPFLLVGLVPERAGDALAGRGRTADRLQSAFGALLLVLGVLLFTQHLALVGSLTYTLEAFT